MTVSISITRHCLVSALCSVLMSAPAHASAPIPEIFAPAAVSGPNHEAAPVFDTDARRCISSAAALPAARFSLRTSEPGVGRRRRSRRSPACGMTSSRQWRPMDLSWCSYRTDRPPPAAARCRARTTAKCSTAATCGAWNVAAAAGAIRSACPIRSTAARRFSRRRSSQTAASASWTSSASRSRGSASIARSSATARMKLRNRCRSALGRPPMWIRQSRPTSPSWSSARDVRRPPAWICS